MISLAQTVRRTNELPNRIPLLCSGAGSASFSLNVFGCTNLRLAQAARALACAMAGALLLFELLAANGAFHQAFHHSDRSASNNCVLCLFAKGQVDSPESTPILSTPVQVAVFQSLPVESIVLVDFSYLSFPSRAPPAFFSSLSVVG